MDAYVYLLAEPGRLEDIVIELTARRGVRRAVGVVGDWDVMVSVEGPDFASIARTVAREIHTIQGVTRTYTTPVVPTELVGVEPDDRLGLRIPMYREGEACYVHIRVAAGSAAQVVEALAEMEDVSGVAVVAGEYDVVAEISLPWEQASRVILAGIHGIPGVVSTSTSVAIPPFDEEEE